MSHRLIIAALAFMTATGCAEMMGSAPDTTTAESPAATAPPAPTQVEGSEPGVVPVGQELDVRLQDTLSSATAEVEQRFEATTAADLRQGDRVLIPAGSIVRGVVSSVDRAGRVDRTARLTLTFDELVVRGREIPIRATATRVFEGKGLRGDVEEAGVGAGVGGLVGGIIGGLRGALIGAVVGAGGAMVATEGEEVTLPAGTIVRLRLDTPVQIS